MPTPPVVVITGASAGVGRALVRHYARRGASLALIGRDPRRLQNAACEARSLATRLRLPCRTIAIVADVSDAEQIERAAERIERELGSIDLWINNAMVSVFAPVKETSAEEFKRVTEVSYLGYVHGTLSALRRMVPRDRGTIVQVGSALAYRSIPLQAAYCAAKHAIRGFSESLRTELLHDKSRVRVIQVHLPAINTPQFDWSRARMPYEPRPVAPVFQPEVAARAIAWAGQHRWLLRRELWLGLPTLKAILAAKLIPALADRYLARTGYRAQQTETPVHPERMDNLWTPPPGDPGAHGSFDGEAHRRSPGFWLRRNRHWLALLAGAGALATLATRKRPSLKQPTPAPDAARVFAKAL